MAANLLQQAFFTIAQIAERLVCSDKTIRRMIDRGDLPAHKFGGLWRISAVDLSDYERRNRIDQRAFPAVPKSPQMSNDSSGLNDLRENGAASDKAKRYNTFSRKRER